MEAQGHEAINFGVTRSEVRHEGHKNPIWWDISKSIPQILTKPGRYILQNMPVESRPPGCKRSNEVDDSEPRRKHHSWPLGQVAFLV